MQVIVTVIGTDKVGIIAQVTTALANLDVNILDVSQTIMQGAFTMMLLAKIPDDASFKTVKQKLTALGDKIGVEIKVSRQEIFDAMHFVDLPLAGSICGIFHGHASWANTERQTLHVLNYLCLPYFI